MKYSVLIVNYKTKDKVLALVEDLHELLEKLEFEIIIIDNHSGDKFQQTPDKTNIFYMNQNLGFGKAMNYAAAKANGEVLVLVNPDCRIDPKQNFHQFVSSNLESQVGILTSLIRYPDGRIQPNRGSPSGLSTYVFQFLRLGRFKRYFPRFFMRIKPIRNSFIGKYLDYTTSAPKTQECEWVSGAFMIVRKENFEKVSGFDPNFFMYCEDEDLCIRVRELGLKIMYSSEFTLIHEVGGAQLEFLDQRLKYSELMRLQSNLYFLSKYHSAVKVNFLRIFYGFSYLTMSLKIRHMSKYLKVGSNFLIGKVL